MNTHYVRFVSGGSTPIKVNDDKDLTEIFNELNNVFPFISFYQNDKIIIIAKKQIIGITPIPEERK